MKRTALRSTQSFENATLPLKKKRRNELFKLLRSFASDNSIKAYALRQRLVIIINNDDAARFEKLVNRHDFLIKKMLRGRKLTDKEEKLIKTVDGLLSEH